MKTTKQKRRYAIDLPREVIDVLRWHVDADVENDNASPPDSGGGSIGGSTP